MNMMFEITRDNERYYVKERLLGCQHGDGLTPMTKTPVLFESINHFCTRTGCETITVSFADGAYIAYSNGVVTTSGDWTWLQDVLLICYGVTVSELTDHAEPDYPAPAVSVDGERFTTHWGVVNGIEFPKLY